MPIPGDLTTITVTASYPTISGGLQSGKVVFDPGQPIMDAVGHVIFEGAVTALVFNSVMRPAVFPHNDQADINPQGFLLKVTETLNGVTRAPYWIGLPTSLGSTVDLSDLSPVTNLPVVPSGNIDGGSAETGLFPVSSIDDGSAASGQFPAGNVDGGYA